MSFCYSSSSILQSSDSELLFSGEAILQIAEAQRDIQSQIEESVSDACKYSILLVSAPELKDRWASSSFQFPICLSS